MSYAQALGSSRHPPRYVHAHFPQCLLQLVVCLSPRSLLTQQRCHELLVDLLQLPRRRLGPPQCRQRLVCLPPPRLGHFLGHPQRIRVHARVRSQLGSQCPHLLRHRLQLRARARQRLAQRSRVRLRGGQSIRGLACRGGRIGAGARQHCSSRGRQASPPPTQHRLGADAASGLAPDVQQLRRGSLRAAGAAGDDDHAAQVVAGEAVAAVQRRQQPHTHSLPAPHPHEAAQATRRPAVRWTLDLRSTATDAADAAASRCHVRSSGATASNRAGGAAAICGGGDPPWQRGAIVVVAAAGVVVLR